MDFTDTEIEHIKTLPIAKLSQASREGNPYFDIFHKIKKNTEFLDIAYPDKKIGFSLRLYCVYNNIVEIPSCKECGSKIIISNYDSEFNMYCSSKCRAKNNNKLSPEIYDTLNDYDWFYTQRIENRLSYSDIGKLLGISEYPVLEYARKHGLNKEKYNQSKITTKEKLEDGVWLHEQHVVNHRTCKDIATEIVSSKATISVALKNHNIQANPPNSYNRDHVTRSQQEIEISEFISSLGFDIEIGNRTILNGYEIDILIPSMKIGIEHHGLYAHAYKPEETEFSKRKDSKYHRMKYQLATQKSYHLIQVFGDQWQFQKDIVKSVIASKLGITTKIYARKCKIVELPSGIKNKFLDENHLQGSDRSSIRYGLEHNGLLVAVMTFNKTRYSKEFDWELTRYCGLKNHTIVGGFSKLLKHFQKLYDGSIISYSDCMWSTGNVYKQHGFELIRENAAGYFYVTPDKQQRLHRNNFRKSQITTKEDVRTEEEIMYSKGYMKIFDAGNKVWVLR